MAIFMYIATAAGLFIVSLSNGNFEVIRHVLKDQSLTSVAVSEGTIIAGTANGIWRSADNGQTWIKSDENLSIKYIRWMASSNSPANIFLAGTEPAGIFVSRDGAKSWQNTPEVGRLRDKHDWYLPYSPGAGCVRGFAIAESVSPAVRIYAAVEVGGVLVSDDNGRSWQLVEGSDGNPDISRRFEPLVHPDVHSISQHPTSTDLVVAATGGGLFQSSDGGRSWKNIYRCYIRAVWLDPADPQHIIAGPADGVSRNGRIEESQDGGQTWQMASGGMKAPWPGHMVERFYQTDNKLFAILSNGELWSKSLRGLQWQHVLPEIDSVKAVVASR